MMRTEATCLHGIGGLSLRAGDFKLGIRPGGVAIEELNHLARILRWTMAVAAAQRIMMAIDTLRRLYSFDVPLGSSICFCRPKSYLFKFKPKARSLLAFLDLNPIGLSVAEPNTS